MSFRVSLLAGLFMVLALAAPRADAAMADADVAVRFFEQTCLKHFADRDGLKARLGEGRDLALPEMRGGIEKYFLGGAPGRVWLLKQGETGVFALALRDDGLCTVFARRAAEARVLENLDALFAGNDFFTREAVDSEHVGVMTRRDYRVVPGGGEAASSVMGMSVSTTTETEGVGYQAAISLDLPRAGD